MKISELWLREWVNPAIDIQKIADLLTMAGLEVDSIYPVSGQLKHIVVAQIISCRPHPEAPHLTICQVSCDKHGKEILQIICDAANIREKLYVVLAKVNAILPDGMLIELTKVHGEPSMGRLCSVAELGLGDDKNIMELDDNAEVGMAISDYLALNDKILDINLTPNRADCFSIQGIAREVAALTNHAFNCPMPDSNAVTTALEKQIDIQASEACTYYAGRIIAGINNQIITPIWLQERLRRLGIRSINAVVDIINYVMLELGQPMHAFDAQKIGQNIHIRYSHGTETLTLLNGQTINLKTPTLLIADDVKPLALAGIMGGQESSVSEQTKIIFLESAYFNPTAIAGVARQFGLSTDSAQRFERGVDPNLQHLALERVTTLLLSIVGGQAGPITIDTTKHHTAVRPSISFNPAKVKQITGVELAYHDIKMLLVRLGMTIDEGMHGWQVTPPSHRFDIHLDVDLVEEVIRLNGYDNIPDEDMQVPTILGKIDAHEIIQQKALDFFVARGYHEIISYSFVDPTLQEMFIHQSQALTLLNPISSELSQMRTSMWPGLVAAMVYNMHRQQTAIKFIECGVIFDFNQKMVTEKACIAGLLTGEIGTFNWSETKRKFDFFDIKGDLDAFFSHTKLEPVFNKSSHQALHPGKSAEICLNDKAIGWCGVLHPRIAEALDLHSEVMLFQIDLESLSFSTTPRYKPISRYPQIRRDISFLVDLSVSGNAIKQSIYCIKHDWLKSVDIFDVYIGSNIPPNKKSLAISLVLQHSQRTLVDSEINQLIDAIISELQQKHNITLRDEL